MFLRVMFLRNNFFVQLKKQLQKVSGFTLIELLVVIGIIAILSTIGTVTYSSVRQKARNAARTQNVENYVQALYTIKASSIDNKFPGDSTWDCLGDYSGNKCWSNNNISESSGPNDVLRGYFGGNKLPPAENDSIAIVDCGTYSQEGFIYRTYNNGDEAEIGMMLEGNNQECPANVPFKQNWYECTYCKASHDNNSTQLK